jgi:hypothetical protein
VGTDPFSTITFESTNRLLSDPPSDNVLIDQLPEGRGRPMDSLPIKVRVLYLL